METFARTSARLPLFALALIVALYLPAVAQDAPAPAPAPGEGDGSAPAAGEEAGESAAGEGEGEDGDAEAEEPEIVPGGETPRAAAEGFLEGLKTRNYRQVMAMLRPSVRRQLEEQGIGEPLLKGMRLESYKLGDITVDGTSAVVRYTWKLSLNLGLLIDAVVAGQLRELRQRGMSEEDLELQEELMREIIGEVLQDLKEHFERPAHRMTLRLENERWFIEQPLEMPQGFDNPFGD